MGYEKEEQGGYSHRLDATCNEEPLENNNYLSSYDLLRDEILDLNEVKGGKDFEDLISTPSNSIEYNTCLLAPK